MGSLATRAEARQPLRIRRAAIRDAARLAALSTELGYPSFPAQVRRRLARIRRDAQHEVYVAEGPDEQIVGWVHASVSYLVESDAEAEIGGLVVDEAERGRGAGCLLMQHVEQWARKKGLKSVYFRSNIIRKDAHAFYQKLGYQIVKTQYAFRKML